MQEQGSLLLESFLETVSAANATLFKSIKAHAKHFASIILGQPKPAFFAGFLCIAVKGSFTEVLKQVKDILAN